MCRFFNCILLVVFLGAGAFFAMPYVSVANLAQALEDEDASAVEKYVDFDELQNAFAQNFAKKAGFDASERSFGALIANGIAAAFVKEVVSADSMVMVFKDKGRRDQFGFSTDYAALWANGDWQDMSHFVLFNKEGEPVTLLEREGWVWKVTALRFK